MVSYFKRSAMEIGREIEACRLRPDDLVNNFYDQISLHSEKFQIYSELSSNRASVEAEASTRRAREGQRLSPLDGVPVSWKDLFDSKDIPTEAGSALLRGRVPNRDCTVLDRATAAGCVCLGKTHMSELAFSGLGINPNTKKSRVQKSSTPPNPFNKHWVPGGSSSGAAASVSHDLATIAIGSDTGGSVRIPSAWHGLVGLKTTQGLIPNTGVVPLCPGFDTIGPLARTVEDAHVMHTILAGMKYEPLSAASAAEQRFGVLTNDMLSPVDEAPQRAFDDARQRLEAAGATFETLSLPGLDELFALSPILFPYEAWREWGDMIEANPNTMFRPVEERFKLGKAITAAQYHDAWQKMEQLRGSILQEIAQYDALVLPTVTILPPNTNDLLSDLDDYNRANLWALRNTRIANLLGTCALTLPTRENACGFMLIGRPMGELELLTLGSAIERVVRG